jgi:hypothetical protein
MVTAVRRRGARGEDEVVAPEHEEVRIVRQGVTP